MSIFPATSSLNPHVLKASSASARLKPMSVTFFSFTSTSYWVTGGSLNFFTSASDMNLVSIMPFWKLRVFLPRSITH